MAVIQYMTEANQRRIELLNLPQNKPGAFDSNINHQDIRQYIGKH